MSTQNHPVPADIAAELESRGSAKWSTLSLASHGRILSKSPQAATASQRKKRAHEHLDHIAQYFLPIIKATEYPEKADFYRKELVMARDAIKAGHIDSVMMIAWNLGLLVRDFDKWQHFRFGRNLGSHQGYEREKGRQRANAIHMSGKGGRKAKHTREVVMKAWEEAQQELIMTGNTNPKKMACDVLAAKRIGSNAHTVREIRTGRRIAKKRDDSTQ